MILYCYDIIHRLILKRQVLLLYKYIINGGKKLYGSVDISGAKNAAVAIIPAAIMVKGVCKLENIPMISDTLKLFEILRRMGAVIVEEDDGSVSIDCTDVYLSEAIFDLTRQIRASYYLIGAMLSRFGKCVTTMPGGCNFGERPIDQHIKGMRALGAYVDTSEGFIRANALQGRLRGSRVYLDKVSVGATINIMLAACLAEGLTVIENVAKEPHIVDLANFLNSMGADVRGAGTNVIKIRGVNALHSGSYCLIPDQIEAGTYMAAVAATGGKITINNVIPKHLDCISGKLIEMGVKIEEGDDYVVVTRDEPLFPTSVETLPYPGFPTDMQPQLATVMCLAAGSSVVTEGVWEERFRYTEELKKMGAKISVLGKKATITGPCKLKGAEIVSCDLRAGAAMVIAGLCAEGRTEVLDVNLIERGYYNIVEKLHNLGADIMIAGEDD